MTVRNMQNQTVTLVGRGANYPVDNGIVPSFVDADGKQYFLALNASGNTFCAIVDGQLRVDANVAAPISGIGYDRMICVNNPAEAYNSTSALVFAQRCGLDVALGQIVLYTRSGGLAVPIKEGTGLTCEVSLSILTSVDGLVLACFCEEGWDEGISGFVGCSFENIPESSYPDDVVICGSLNDQWVTNLPDRQQSHNAWVWVLAGVPESVFTA